jgi:hypothetical protein
VYQDFEDAQDTLNQESLISYPKVLTDNLEQLRKNTPYAERQTLNQMSQRAQELYRIFEILEANRLSNTYPDMDIKTYNLQDLTEMAQSRNLNLNEVTPLLDEDSPIPLMQKFRDLICEVPETEGEPPPGESMQQAIDGESGEGEESEEGEGEDPGLDEAAEARKKRPGRQVERHKGRIEKYEGGGDAEDESNHGVRLLTPKKVINIPTDAHINNVIQEQIQSGARRINFRTGNVSHKTWRLNHGDTRVFSRNRTVPSKAVILIDMSGSTGCYCARCRGHYMSSEAASKDTVNTWIESYAGRAQMARYMIEKICPDVESYGFTSGSRYNWIVQMTPGLAPSCTHRLYEEIEKASGGDSAGGNVDCSALMWLEHKLLSMGGTPACIVMTDGQPSGAGGTHCDTTAHTKYRAHRLLEQGLTYAHLDMAHATPSRLYPAELNYSIATNDVTTFVDTVKEAAQYVNSVTGGNR